MLYFLMIACPRTPDLGHACNGQRPRSTLPRACGVGASAGPDCDLRCPQLSHAPRHGTRIAIMKSHRPGARKITHSEPCTAHHARASRGPARSPLRSSMSH